MTALKPEGATPWNKRKRCPDCGRVKADSADDVLLGACEKWWAIRDKEALVECKAIHDFIASGDARVVAAVEEPVGALIVESADPMENHGYDKTVRWAFTDACLDLPVGTHECFTRPSSLQAHGAQPERIAVKCPQCGDQRYAELAVRPVGGEALHASAPKGYKCADCTMDKEPCPICYAAWWQKRHPNTMQVGASAAPSLTTSATELLREAVPFLRHADWDDAGLLADRIVALLERSTTTAPTLTGQMRDERKCPECGALKGYACRKISCPQLLPSSTAAAQKEPDRG